MRSTSKEEEKNKKKMVNERKSINDDENVKNHTAKSNITDEGMETRNRRPNYINASEIYKKQLFNFLKVERENKAKEEKRK